jgi:hypothetical protein
MEEYWRCRREQVAKATGWAGLAQTRETGSSIELRELAGREPN